jgi:hypothetical protein
MNGLQEQELTGRRTASLWFAVGRISLIGPECFFGRNILNQEMFEVHHAAAFCEPQFYEAWDNSINHLPEFF